MTRPAASHLQRTHTCAACPNTISAHVVGDCAAAALKRDVVALLRDPGATFAGVARALGVDRRRVVRVARERGITRPAGPPRGDGAHIDDAELRRLAALGAGDEQVARHFGVSRQAVWARRQKLGIERGGTAKD